MSFKVVAGAGSSNINDSYFDGEDMNKISRVLNGEVTGANITFADPIIFKYGNFKLRNSGDTYSLTIRPTLSQTGILEIPNLSNDTIVCLASVQNLINKTLTAPKIVDGGYISDATGNELLQFDSVPNAVNHIKISNAATNQDPLIEPYGDSNTNINLKLKTKGDGKVTITGNDVTKELDFDTSLQNANTTCTLSTGSTTGTRTVTLPSTTSTLAISSAAQTFTGTQTFSDLITANGGISLGTGDRIKADTTGNEIGIYVRNEAVTIGNEGTLQVPQLVQSAAPNTDDLNAAFGIVQGSIGLWRNTTTPTSNRIYLRTSAGTWHYLTLIPSSI